MASAATILGSGGHAFLVPTESAAPPRLVLQPRAAQADLSSAAPIAAASNIAGSSPSWAAWSCVAAAAVAAGSAGARRAARGRAERRRLVVRAAAAGDDEEAPRAVGRAQLLRGVGGAGASSFVLPMAPEPALAASLKDATSTLTSYGLAELAPAEAPPFGWNVAVEPIGIAPDAYYGKFNLGGDPQVVVFVVPPLWVITKPNIDFNGSAGTVQANDYGKGDAATLWVDTEYSGVDLADFKKKDFSQEMFKALTTKGKDLIENLSIGKVRDGSPGYKIVDYTYEIESAAGFTIARSGVGSFAQVGEKKNIQILWTAVVTGRANSGMMGDLARIAESFRIGSVPKSISTAMVKEFKNMDQAMSASDIPQAQY